MTNGLLSGTYFITYYSHRPFKYLFPLPAVFYLLLYPNWKVVYFNNILRITSAKMNFVVNIIVKIIFGVESHRNN